MSTTLVLRQNSQFMLRRSFLPPIPEHKTAADLLSLAANALIENNLSLAEQLIQEADLRALRDFDYLISGPINPAIHRQSKNPKYPKIETSGSRMPSTTVSRQVYARDGYRCRFCSSRVVLKEARKVLCDSFPKAARWGNTNEGKHFGLAVLSASVDHVLPFKRGGTNDLSNLVTACSPCQFGRNQWTLEEVEIEDPRSYAPVVDEWDGLSRLVGFKPKLLIYSKY